MDVKDYSRIDFRIGKKAKIKKGLVISNDRTVMHAGLNVVYNLIKKYDPKDIYLHPKVLKFNELNLICPL